MLPVLVTDKDGKYVEGLTKNDFVIRVGDSRVDFDTFERDEGAPVSFAFLVDTSGSMGVGNKLDNAKNAIRSILRNRVPGDDFALFTFSEGKVRLVTDSSPDPAELLIKALWELEASGQTALFDAVAMTPELMKGRNNKRAILLFTDGVDNASQLSAAQMAEILQRVSVPVYADRHEECSVRSRERAGTPGNVGRKPGASGGFERRQDASRRPRRRPATPGRAHLERGQTAVFAGVCAVRQGGCKISNCFCVRSETRFLGRSDTPGISGNRPRGVLNVFMEVQMLKERWVSSMLTGGALLLGISGLTACATKTYVGEEVAKSSAVDG